MKTFIAVNLTNTTERAKTWQALDCYDRVKKYHASGKDIDHINKGMSNTRAFFGPSYVRHMQYLP